MSLQFTSYSIIKFISLNTLELDHKDNAMKLWAFSVLKNKINRLKIYSFITHRCLQSFTLTPIRKFRIAWTTLVADAILDTNPTVDPGKFRPRLPRPKYLVKEKNTNLKPNTQRRPQKLTSLTNDERSSSIF